MIRARERIFPQDAVTYGDYIYSGKETSIGTEIIQRGYEGEKTVISLLEDGKVISGKSVILSDEITSVYFDYKPESEGEKRMEVRISTLEDEEIKDNNRKLFFPECTRRREPGNDNLWNSFT